MTAVVGSPSDRTALDRIHVALFGCAAPEILHSRFPRAFALLCARHPVPARAALERAIASADDIEALEVAARYRRRLPILPELFRLVTYLAETMPERQADFVAPAGNRVTAWVSIIVGGVRTAWKLSRGVLMIGRYADA